MASTKQPKLAELGPSGEAMGRILDGTLPLCRSQNLATFEKATKDNNKAILFFLTMIMTIVRYHALNPPKMQTPYANRDTKEDVENRFGELLHRAKFAQWH